MHQSPESKARCNLRYQQRLMAEGKCKACRKPRKSYTTLCDDCMAAHRDVMRVRMRDKRAAEKAERERQKRLALKSTKRVASLSSGNAAGPQLLASRVR